MKHRIILFTIFASNSILSAQNKPLVAINKEAPVVESKTISINADPARVWQVLTEIENWSNWNEKIKNPNIKEKADTGVIFSWKSGGSKIKAKIHTYQLHTVLGWEGKTIGAKAIHNWYLESTEKGTKVFVEESMEGWLISLMKNKMKQVLANDMEHWLEQLKKECEKK